ncbi:MAG: hypothetical protein ABIO79_04905 [Ferruginibacter sp.]
MKKIILSVFLITLFTIVTYAQKSNFYPVVVSFNSMCCGVPDNAPVMKLVKDFKKKNRIKRMAVDNIGPMGKEGEYYLAFRLKELSRAQKIRFIQQLKKIAPTMIDKGSVEIKEDQVVNRADLSSRTVITTLIL